MKKNSLLCAIILGIMATSLSAQTRKKDYTHQVDSVLNLMTLEEKVGQMIQYSNNKLLTGPSLDSRNHTEEIKRGEVGSIFNILTVERARQYQDLAMQSRLRIPLIFGLDVVHGMRTIFPIPMAEAASFNLELIKKQPVWRRRRLLPMGFTGRLPPWLISPGMPVGGVRWKELVKTLGMVVRWQRLV